MKRMLAILLCVAMLLTALPMVSNAEPMTKSELTNQTKAIYDASLAASERESFQGVCGMMSSYQLWKMGVNSWLESYDGNKQFDAYAAKEVTSGGYYISAYPADTYTLEQALNHITENGTKDAYNILVGFEWTNTEAGNKFGHACVINGIIDGTVYFVESFYTSLGGEEGNVITCSIPKFATFFADWTVFDGVIHFTRDYADSCESYGTNLFIKTRFDSTLRSMPCLVGQNGCEALRSLKAGERLHATAVYKNSRDELYYRVQDGEMAGYVSAGAVSIARVNGEDLKVEDQQDIPTNIGQGRRLSIGGRIVAQNAQIGNVLLKVTDAAGVTYLQATADVNAETFDLQQLNTQLGVGALPEGAYTLALQVESIHTAVSGKQLRSRYISVDLLQSPLLVGNVTVAGQSRANPIPTREGWFWDGQTWYCYENGQPKVGWQEMLGVRYYLKEDGSVTTGWAEVDGVMRYFSATGAMCFGWLHTEAGTYYLLPDGRPATGTRQFRGQEYTFDETGLLVK